jgi:hypothetical protein
VAVYINGRKFSASVKFGDLVTSFVSWTSLQGAGWLLGWLVAWVDILYRCAVSCRQFTVFSSCPTTVPQTPSDCLVTNYQFSPSKCGIPLAHPQQSTELTQSLSAAPSQRTSLQYICMLRCRSGQLSGMESWHRIHFVQFYCLVTVVIFGYPSDICLL